MSGRKTPAFRAGLGPACRPVFIVLSKSLFVHQRAVNRRVCSPLLPMNRLLLPVCCSLGSRDKDVSTYGGVLPKLGMQRFFFVQGLINGCISKHFTQFFAGLQVFAGPQIRFHTCLQHTNINQTARCARSQALIGQHLRPLAAKH